MYTPVPPNPPPPRLPGRLQPHLHLLMGTSRPTQASDVHWVLHIYGTVTRQLHKCNGHGDHWLIIHRVPGEIKRREVELDPQVSPEEIMSREVELGCESWTSFASGFSSTVVPRNGHCPCDCPSTAVETAIAQCTSRCAKARGHRLNTSIVLAAVHGLSGLFRAVSAVEPSLFRPLPPVPVPNKPSRFCGRKAKWTQNQHSEPVWPSGKALGW